MHRVVKPSASNKYEHNCNRQEERCCQATVPTALLVVVDRIAVAVPYHNIEACAGCGFCFGNVLVLRKRGDVVVIDAHSVRIDARVTAVMITPTRVVTGADAGTFAAITTVVTWLFPMDNNVNNISRPRWRVWKFVRLEKGGGILRLSPTRRAHLVAEYGLS